MTQLRPLSLLAACLLLGACASQTPKSAPPATATSIAPSAETPVRDDAGVTAQPAAAGIAAPDALPVTAAAPTDQASADASGSSSGAPTAAEDDFDALYGPTTPQAGGNGAPAQPGAQAYDPWERYNRGMHRFNMAVDRGVARPLATAYTKVVPSPARLASPTFSTTSARR